MAVGEGEETTTNGGMPKTENADALKSHPNLALSNRISPYISYYSRGSILPVSRLHTLHTTAYSYSYSHSTQHTATATATARA